MPHTAPRGTDQILVDTRRHFRNITVHDGGGLVRVAQAIAKEVIVPAARGCCAFASTNRTCEIGMTRATGHPYRHILELLDEAIAPGPAVQAG